METIKELIKEKSLDEKLNAIKVAQLPLSKVLELQVLFILEGGPQLNRDVKSNTKATSKNLSAALGCLRLNKLIDRKALNEKKTKWEYTITEQGISVLPMIYWLIGRYYGQKAKL